MNAVTETTAAVPVSGVEIHVPLSKLKKSPRNARKVPHGESARGSRTGGNSVSAMDHSTHRYRLAGIGAALRFTAVLE